MAEKKLTLIGDCFLEINEYQSFRDTLSLCYTEHSPDPWYSDNETEVDLTVEQAEEIIKFLTPFVERNKGRAE